MFNVILLLFAFVNISFNEELDSFLSRRNNFLDVEKSLYLGSDIELTAAEKSVDAIIRSLKEAEINVANTNITLYPFIKHYFEYKNEILDSKLYQIIQKLPKGAALHVHDLSLLGPDYLMNITYHYNDTLYICIVGEVISFLHSEATPTTTCSTTWELIHDVRSKVEDVASFDAWVRSKLTLVIPTPEDDTNIDIVWNRAVNVWAAVTPLVTYTPVWERFIYDSLVDFRNDGCMYMEMRSLLEPLYELDGSTHDQIYSAEVMKNASARFLQDYNDFYGVKLIYAPLRKVNVTVVEYYLNLCRKLKEMFPEFFIGFDLTGQEDKGEPLKDFLPVLLEAQNEFNYFFHAGETNFYGSDADENLMDALLLGTKRLGHGFNLLKHPNAVKILLENNIGLEVSVISNSLSLGDDVRNHPLASFLALDFPVTLSSDDPGLWKSSAMTDDFYVAFVGVANKHSGLEMLKKLAINSIKYSVLSENEKTEALNLWQEKWDNFFQNYNL